MSVAIFGATSALGGQVARLHAEKGDELILVARDKSKLETVAADLKIRGAANVIVFTQDLSDPIENNALINKLDELALLPDTAYFFQGVLPDQEQCQESVEEMLSAFNINTLGIFGLLGPLANKFEQRGSGNLVVISSVAGDRGRQSNYVYGTTKGALNVYLQGLRNRLTPKGVKVVTVKPGFIDTPMTESFKKGPLWAQPKQVALGIVQSVNKGKDQVYLPWFWSGIMLIIKSVPEPIFKKLKL